MGHEGEPTSANHLGRADQQCHHHVEIAVRRPAEYGNTAPYASEAGDVLTPVMVVILDPCGVFLHVIAGHVIIHRYVRLIVHIEVSEAFGQQRIQRDDWIVLDDFEPCLVEIGHILGRHRAPLVADLLGLNTGGFHRVGILLGVSVGHLIEIEDGREVLFGFV